MRARTGRYQACDRCRKLHRRCHRSPGKDTCQACKTAGVSCSIPAVIFKVAQFSFDKVSPPSIPSEETSLVYRDEIRLNESFSGRNYSKTPEHINGDNILNPSTQGVYDEIVPDFSNSPGNESDRVTSPIGNGIGSLNSWSLQSELEASLLIYFLTTLSPWFDYCDQTQPYRNYIANHAATDMTLLYAVLAVSARHQSSTGQKLSQLADEYQRHCLNRLIPALSDPSTTSGDAVLASATVLRFFEEMTEPLEDSVFSHSISAHLLIRVRDGQTNPSAFADSAFILILRTEIFFANIAQRPIGSFVDQCNIDSSLNATSESMWAFRAIAHAARATNFAYAKQTSPSTNEYENLIKYIDDWESLCPKSFGAIYFRDHISSSTPFPCLWYASEYHLAARQYIELARILLLASSTQSCLTRIRQTRAGEGTDDCIRKSIRLICGISLSNPQVAQARTCAGLVIALFGELFYDKQETKILLQLISDAESHLGWPCVKSQDRLKEIWGI